jgi:hypothetical protein
VFPLRVRGVGVWHASVEVKKERQANNHHLVVRCMLRMNTSSHIKYLLQVQERGEGERRRGEREEGEGETETLLTALTVLSSRLRKGKERGRGEGGGERPDLQLSQYCESGR